MTSSSKHSRIGIVGCGNVGSTAAYSLLLQGTGSELALVDHDPALAEAQRTDLLHATPFSHPLRIDAGPYDILQGCSLVILAAGVGQRPGETRMQLLERNAGVFAEIIPHVMRHAGDPILLVATNPLDVMTQVATRLSGLPPSRVIGSGTMLDSARFRSLLARHVEVSPSSVHASVLGEHGDSEVLAWSSARIAGMPLADFAAARGRPLTPQVKADIDRGVRRAAYEIIAGKGYTCYGIGAALARLARSIVQDERAVLTACALMPEVEGIPEVALSLPLVIGREGMQMPLVPQLDEDERIALRASARLIKDVVTALGY